MVTNPDPNKAGDRTVYALESSGRAISLPAWRKLAPNLVPVADGLFGEELSQTFTWREPAPESAPSTTHG